MGQVLAKRRTVLIVEDDLDLRHLTAALLADEQLETIECVSAEAALAIMLSHLFSRVHVTRRSARPSGG